MATKPSVTERSSSEGWSGSQAAVCWIPCATVLLQVRDDINLSLEKCQNYLKLPMFLSQTLRLIFLLPGMAEGPVTPLLSAITQRGRNYFVITDKGPGASSQASAQRA